MRNIFIIVTGMLFVSCSDKNLIIKYGGKIIIPSHSIETTDSLLHFNNGFWYYKNELYSGNIIDRFGSKNIHQNTSYYKGKEECVQLTYFDENKLSEKRFYHRGEKDSTHSGWWPNGNKRFEYHFKDGVYQGDFKEWYEDGKPLKFIHYTNGVDDNGKGWRQNGKLYMNFVMKNGRRYGLNNSNLCYTLKNGNGEFVTSVDSDATKALRQ